VSGVVSNRVRVVFIGGYARTGSTLLDRLLGQIDGFASFGEVRHIWERCFRGDQLCGCGLRFHACPFWSEVARVGFGGFDAVDPVEIGRDKRAVDSFWNIPRIVAGGWPGEYRERLQRYSAAVSALYRSMADVSGANVLVDSTKDPQHAYLLHTIPGLDVRMVHLVRDARAVAYSWRRVRQRPEIHWRDAEMPRFPIVRSALAWDFANLGAGAARWAGMPSVRVRYEDLVADPRGSIERIVDELELGPADLSFLDPPFARLRPAHTMAGNPIRFDQGKIEITPDVEWSERMRADDRYVVTALAWPLLARYGYLCSGGGPGPREMWRILRMAFAFRREPTAFSRAVAALVVRYLRNRGVRPYGRWLDVGAGGGAVAEALSEAGARVVALDVGDRRLPDLARSSFVVGRGERLPFADGSFDGVVSSNVLEHAADTRGLIEEALRVCRPGGTVYLSWTTWFSPMGGHEWSPFHYLGPELGIRAYRALRGAMPPGNLPGRTLFRVDVSRVLRLVQGCDVEILDVAPRYWPSLRLISRVPGIREVAMWNCVVLMRPRQGAKTWSGPTRLDSVAR
jgi:SAM-dependent methyltransferase